MKRRNIVIYFAVVVFALIFLFIGNRIASRDMAVELHGDNVEMFEARVSAVVDIAESEDEWWSSRTITFEAKLTKGDHKNKTITATQNIGSHIGVAFNEVSEGDKVLLTTYGGEWFFIDHVRIDKIIVLGAVFVALLLLFGRIKGLNAILSLGFTCVAIFAVFIPSILSGKNIYLWAIIVCVYSIVVMLFILNGINRKSIAAAAGCFGGVVAAGLITLIMNGALELTGWLNEESIYLLDLPTQNPIDLKAIIFAGIIIGAVGAIMDVSVSVASALSELKEKAPALSFGELFKSGVNIGRDIMGSMTNTLVLAYIGSSLTVILLLIVYSGSFTDLFNRELVIVELLQALVGSMGILLTMPLTALVSAALYSKKQDNAQDFS